jgi:hypothetical protein
MTDLFSMLVRVLQASWSVLLESAPFVLLGFFIAGIIKAFLPENFVAKHLGGKGLGGIFKASVFGVPIPLCSCGVLPAAAGLKKQGAGKGALASFLISTPETGVDSIAVSYALLDPVMTIFRPIAAIVTAIATGIAITLTERVDDHAEAEVAPKASDSSGCSSSCCCGHSKKEKPQSAVDKFKAGMSFAFGELLKDVGAWLFVGVLLSGVISVFISPEIVEKYFSNEYLSMAMMLAISVPLYVCATASTPIAAALALKGISPGAALVFLLAGPATNLASMPVISKMLGRKATLVYLLVIVIMSFISGLLVNYLYARLGLDVRNWVRGTLHEEHGIFAIVSAIALIALVLKSSLPARSGHHH